MYNSETPASLLSCLSVFGQTLKNTPHLDPAGIKACAISPSALQPRPGHFQIGGCDARG